MIQKDGMEQIKQCIQGIKKYDDVVVFSQSYCPSCRAAKELFATLPYDIAVVELDKTSDGPQGPTRGRQGRRPSDGLHKLLAESKLNEAPPLSEFAYALLTTLNSPSKLDQELSLSDFAFAMELDGKCSDHFVPFPSTSEQTGPTIETVFIHNGLWRVAHLALESPQSKMCR
jgi:hypothetical protein